MRKTLIAAIAVTLGIAPAIAHDFWLQPLSYWTRPGAAVPMVLLVGHGAARQRSTISIDRFSQFRSIGPAGTADRRSALSLGSAADASLRFADPGTHVVYFTTSNIPSDLPAKRFNDYAIAEGLTPILARRKADGTTNKPGRELYSRRGKALVQVGPATRTAQAYVTKPVGMSLEIVPLTNPYALDAAATLTVQILYQGRPLPGALVKLNNLAADAKPVEARRTDAAGRATFRARRAGLWQYNVVWSQPLANSAVADYLTTFSSLTFGFPAAAPVR